MLRGLRILVVEDEAIIAMHLALTIEDHHGEVIGPAASVADALTMVGLGDIIHGAILDGNLGDGDITPVALQLLAANIPLVIYSGVGVPHDLNLQCPGLPMVLKPSGAAKAVHLLAGHIQDRASGAQHATSVPNSRLGHGFV